MTPADDNALVFQTHRPRLVRLAYRMLGSVAEAEDIVQDGWMRWRTVDPRRHPRAGRLADPHRHPAVPRPDQVGPVAARDLCRLLAARALVGSFDPTRGDESCPCWTS
jgi:hypothetical protein